METKKEINKTAYQIKFTNGYSRVRADCSIKNTIVDNWINEQIAAMNITDSEELKATNKKYADMFKTNLKMKNFEAVPHEIILKAIESSVVIDIQNYYRAVYIRYKKDKDGKETNELDIEQLEKFIDLLEAGIEVDLHEFYTELKKPKSTQSKLMRAKKHVDGCTTDEKLELLAKLQADPEVAAKLALLNK